MFIWSNYFAFGLSDQIILLLVFITNWIYLHRIYSIKHNFHGKCLDSRQHSVFDFEITNLEWSIAVIWSGRWFLKIYISMSGVIREILKWQVLLVTRLASVNEMWIFPLRCCFPQLFLCRTIKAVLIHYSWDPCLCFLHTGYGNMQ